MSHKKIGGECLIDLTLAGSEVSDESKSWDFRWIQRMESMIWVRDVVDLEVQSIV